MLAVVLSPAPLVSRRRRAVEATSQSSLGDPEAFARIYERHHQALYRYCRSILRHDEDARDALQSTMLRSFAALQDERRDIELRPWLYRIAHNEAITILRQRRGRAAPPAAVDLQAYTLDRSLEDRARLAELRADLADLPDRQRAALVMRELSGLSHAEIAAVLDSTARNVKQTLFEARTALVEFRAGREMACEPVRRVISDGDGRVLRGRRIRGHLRACAGCQAFRADMARRRADLAALAPPLPLAAAAALLGRILPSGGAAATALGAGSATSGGILSGGAAKAAVAVVVATTAAGGAVVAPHRTRAAGGGEARTTAVNKGRRDRAAERAPRRPATRAVRQHSAAPAVSAGTRGAGPQALAGGGLVRAAATPAGAAQRSTGSRPAGAAAAASAQPPAAGSVAATSGAGPVAASGLDPGADGAPATGPRKEKPAAAGPKDKDNTASAGPNHDPPAAAGPQHAPPASARPEKDPPAMAVPDQGAGTPPADPAGRAGEDHGHGHDGRTTPPTRP